MYRLLIFALLFAGWAIFSGLFDAFHLTLGVISCALVTYLSSDLLFSDRSQSFGDRVEQAIRFLGYALWLLWQIVLANIYILKLALTPGGLEEISPRIIRYRTKLQSDFAKFVLAQSITLTPGTVTIRIDGDILYIHAISQAAEEGLDGSMEGWIGYVFEPDRFPKEKEAAG